ncbi:MAG: domain G-beta repeat protein, partial [Myxococcaceae bacterium]|nr:domain G-beta repeat protein [Myxococcaceae bacterium]
MRGGLLCGLLCLAGCQTLPRLPDSTLAALTGPGYLTGAVAGLRGRVVLNEIDFVYDAKFSDDSRRLALSRLGAKSFDLLVFEPWRAPPRPLFEAAINPHAFDVESVAFSPDGRHLAAVSRDGSVRLFDAQTGAAVGGWLTEEPLVTVAFHPQGRWLAVGSEQGLVTLLELVAAPPEVKLRFANERQAHQGQVRGLAFAADGRLFSAGWDKAVVVLGLEEQPATAHAAAVRFERKAGFAQVRGTINDLASVLIALDARMPQVLVLRSTLAQAIGLDPAKLTETTTVTSSYGAQLARVAHGVRLAFKGLKLDGLDAVICDACLPADAQAVLGQGFLDAVELAFDETAGQVVLKRKDAGGASGERQLAITERKRFTFPAYPNDLSIDRAGRVLGLAFSQTKAERTLEVYAREKRHEVEPEREWDVGARVDADTGAVLQTYRGHRGVVATAAVSPDGSTLATGGWDQRLLLHLKPGPVVEQFGDALRRVRFSPDGRWL